MWPVASGSSTNTGLDGDETGRNVRARREPPVSASDDSDDSDDESEIGSEADIDNAADEDANEAGLFRKTVGYSVIESYVNGVMELWRVVVQNEPEPLRCPAGEGADRPPDQTGRLGPATGRACRPGPVHRRRRLRSAEDEGGDLLVLMERVRTPMGRVHESQGL
jgi:hypothetical protein